MNNQLTSLPELPLSLMIMQCDTNQLTSLPSLPPFLSVLNCSGNQLTSLPTLLSILERIDCHDNLLTTIPMLPVNLHRLNCLGNRLEILPEIPSTLFELHCELPLFRDAVIDEVLISEMDLDPEGVAFINGWIIQTTNELKQQSKERCTSRCATYKEEIMMKAWHPSRVEKLLEMGYDHEDM